jgi:phosphomannomutase
VAGIFKAYDIRGIYPTQLDEALARRIGRVYPSILDDSDRRGERPDTLVVSHDMRSHSPGLQEALIEGLRDAGMNVLDIGLATTPMNYFAVGLTGAAGGIQVTASHNPSEYNGMKMSRYNARPVSGDHGIPQIEERSQGAPGEAPPEGERGGYEEMDVTGEYRRHILSFLKRPEDGRTLKVVADAANGMGTIYQPILEAAGIELILLYFELDGSFPNHEANPLKEETLEDLRKRVIAEGADLGIAFDGDADRAAFVDEKGVPVGSDLMTALMAAELLERAPDDQKTVVYDLRSSRAVAELIEEKGGTPVRERVGHSFMKATLRERNGFFGGELAGHYYFRDTYCADSSILAVIEVLNLLWRHDRPLSELVAPLLRYAKSPEINFEVEDKQGKIDLLAERFDDGEVDYLDGITVQYPDWWFNVRPSNTEPFLRLVIEAKDDEQLAAKRGELEGLLGTPV